MSRFGSMVESMSEEIKTLRAELEKERADRLNALTESTDRITELLTELAQARAERDDEKRARGTALAQRNCLAEQVKAWTLREESERKAKEAALTRVKVAEDQTHAALAELASRYYLASRANEFIRIIRDQLIDGFIECARCGAEEGLADTDFVHEINDYFAGIESELARPDARSGGVVGGKAVTAQANEIDGVTVPHTVGSQGNPLASAAASNIDRGICRCGHTLEDHTCEKCNACVSFELMLRAPPSVVKHEEHCAQESDGSAGPCDCAAKESSFEGIE